MIFLYVITGGSLFISFILNKDKTIKALKVAWKKIKKILPSFIKMLILISVMLYLLPDKTIAKYLGGTNIFRETILASALGSITIMPGFIAFPVAYSLYSKGAKLSIVLTYIGAAALTRIPMTIFEASFLGIKFSVIRLLVSIPLVILSSIVIGNSFEHNVNPKQKKPLD
ncbi:MAG: hypothetical protein FH761_05540 [Firmicutes bacterium]|nr:hypothetical protein [Bacillota bacterium]